MHNEIVYSTISRVPIRVSYSPYNVYRPEPPHTVSGMHFHDEIEFLRIDHGEFLCHIGDSKVKCRAGDIIYIASRVPHATETLVYGTKTTMLQFAVSNYNSVEISKSLYRFLSAGEAPFHVFKLDTDENRLISSYIDRICTETLSQKPGFDHFISSGVHSIIGHLYRDSLIQDAEAIFNNRYVYKLMPVLTYIDDHYSDQINLPLLSGILNMNPAYFCRVFKKATNSTFTEYLNFVRILKSEKLLTSNSGSVSEIALNVGFSSVSYFNRVFKRFKGVSPSVYRKIRYTVK